MRDILKNIQSIGVIPVVKINDSNKAVDLANALCRAGLPIAEITFRTGAAEKSIRNIADSVPDICACAGTVLTIEDVKRAVDAGAELIFSPGANPRVVKWCVENDVPIVPGCAAPSDIEMCMDLGIEVVKLFPAEVVGGVNMLKALSGPYSGIMFVPTGGINPSNIAQYLSLKNVLACGGSWMVPENAIDSGDFDTIEKLAREAVKYVKDSRLKTNDARIC